MITMMTPHSGIPVIIWQTLSAPEVLTAPGHRSSLKCELLSVPLGRIWRHTSIIMRQECSGWVSRIRLQACPALLHLIRHFIKQKNKKQNYLAKNQICKNNCNCLCTKSQIKLCLSPFADENISVKNRLCSPSSVLWEQWICHLLIVEKKTRK